jgi:DNA (cytosine-5)-methyltransferase 1
LQSFPDWFEFQGSETSAFNQIGNAVPPMLAYDIAGSFRASLESPKQLSDAEIKRRRQPSQLQLLAA